MKHQEPNSNFYVKVRQKFAFLIVVCCAVTSVGASKKYSGLDKLSKDLGKKPDLLLYSIKSSSGKNNSKRMRRGELFIH